MKHKYNYTLTFLGKMIEVDIDKKIHIVKAILDDVYDIMITIKPVIEQMTELDDARKYREDGTFFKAASLFGSIAKKCQELELYPFTPEFLNNIRD